MRAKRPIFRDGEEPSAVCATIKTTGTYPPRRLQRNNLFVVKMKSCAPLRMGRRLAHPPICSSHCPEWIEERHWGFTDARESRFEEFRGVNDHLGGNFRTV
jgi:hypothetical protein